MMVRAIGTRIVREGEDLIPFITRHVPKLCDGDVLAVTSKIVALSENRTAAVKDMEKVVRAESEWATHTKYVWLTEKDGMLMANAGVDASNADGKLVLLPKDSFAAAHKLRSALMKHYHIKKLGVLITDSRVMPLRSGVIGVALGYAGFRGVRDYRGKKDLYGRPLKFTQTNIADSLATAATCAMGEGSERQPLAIISGSCIDFTERVNKKELLIPLKDDMYAPLFKTGARKKSR